MRKLLAIAVAVAFLATPAFAAPSLEMSANMVKFAGKGVIDNSRGAPWCYQSIDFNGYGNLFDATDFWKGEYLFTDCAPGTPACNFDQFTIAYFGILQGPPSANLFIDFFLDDGYLPYAGNWVGGMAVPMVSDGYAHIESYSMTPIAALYGATSFWFTASTDVPDYYAYGHADQTNRIGLDYYLNGWIDLHDHPLYPGYTEVKWYWYGGMPNADLLFAVGTCVPEPAALAVLALGGLALVRRRR
jgi:hypothetical protein